MDKYDRIDISRKRVKKRIQLHIIFVYTNNMNLQLSNEDRIDLKRLLSTSDCENNTEHIRTMKHSTKIQNDIMKLVEFKNSQQTLAESYPDKFVEEARVLVPFLAKGYTDIFNKVIRNEINFEILGKLLYVLKAIEDEKVDQHEGSVLVGKILKELYLDSAVRHGENLDKKNAAEEPPKPKLVEGRPISWKEYKSKN